MNLELNFEGDPVEIKNRDHVRKLSAHRALQHISKLEIFIDRRLSVRSVTGPLFIKIQLHLIRLDVNVKNEIYVFPINYAVVHGHLELIKYFVLLGVNINEKNKNGWSNIHYTDWICKKMVHNMLYT